ncbi:TetR/AcrR family transcriptional regulator [Ureibacillus composti]|nr:TetR/AcrR family transcriptional regulator [Ureibacillus composti]
MDTKSLIIQIATKLFQQKGYLGVGLNEILKVCNISKGSLYHHFPNGKEELLIACLDSLNDAITMDIEGIFNENPTTEEATSTMIEKLIVQYETEGTISGYTFSSIVSEMSALSVPVRRAYADLYEKMQRIYADKLINDGISEERAISIAMMMTASIEGAMMLSLTQKAVHPLRVVSQELRKIIKANK